MTYLNQIAVLLADDSGIVRREFRRILELEDDLKVIGEAKNGREAVAMAHKLHPAVVLMDVAMPELNGLDAACQIHMTLPDTKVLMLSIHDEEAYVIEAVHSGAVGYLIKQTSAGSVCLAIREVQKGNTFFCPSILSRLYKKHRKKGKD